MLSSFALALPKDYGYVAAIAVGSGVLTIWQGILVTTIRSSGPVPYPNAYASHELAEKDPKAKKFNCAQRAHQNTLEGMPFFLFSLLFSGLEWPRLSAGLGAVFLAGRVIYTLGYITGDPKKRTRGTFGHIGDFGLLISSGYLAYKLIVASL